MIQGQMQVLPLSSAVYMICITIITLIFFLFSSYFTDEKLPDRYICGFGIIMALIVMLTAPDSPVKEKLKDLLTKSSTSLMSTPTEDTKLTDDMEDKIAQLNLRLEKITAVLEKIESEIDLKQKDTAADYRK